MTVWIEIDGVDLAVTGEIDKGITPALDRFVARKVCVRGPNQNVQHMLKDGFLAKIARMALVAARDPVPFAYPVQQEAERNAHVDPTMRRIINGYTRTSEGGAS